MRIDEEVLCEYNKITETLANVYTLASDDESILGGIHKLVPKLINRRAEISSTWKILFQQPANWAKTKLYPLGKREQIRGAICGNRTGKTLNSCLEWVYHLTGLYPNDWDGVKFDKQCMPDGVGGEGADLMAFMVLGPDFKQLMQPQAIMQYLLGQDPINSPGTGLIPKDLIKEVQYVRKHTRVVDKVYINNVQGYTTMLEFGTYTQGIETLMGSIYAGFLIDEAPRDDAIVPQAVKRLASAYRLVDGVRKEGGILLMAATPERGLQRTVAEFWEHDGVWHSGLVNISIYETEDIHSKEYIETFVKNCPPWTIDYSVYGKPSAGTGAVFVGTDRNTYLEKKPFVIKPHHKRLYGIDFGYSTDKNVIILLAKDEWDTYHVMWEQVDAMDTNQVARSIAKQFLPKQVEIDAPIVWPRDGTQRRGFGTSIVDEYKAMGVTMQQGPFCNSLLGRDYEDNISVEPGVHLIRTMLIEGTLKIDPRCTNLLSEIAIWAYKKNGTFEDGNNHSIDALRYALLSFNKYAVDGTGNKTKFKAPNVSRGKNGLY